MFTFFATAKILAFLAVFLGGADAHGFLKSPRARNWIAHTDGVHSGGTSSNYPKEYDPQSLNKGGTAGQCGTTETGHNYDRNLNVFGQPMSPAPQAQYRQGQEIDVEVVLTAHHRGHFQFYACPISRGGITSGDCFKQNRLEFVADLLYGAPKDPNYPYRAYIAPTNVAQIDRSYNNLPGTLHRFRLKLPANLSGDLVLLQWHYLTANSCKYDGYDNYAFPTSWGDMRSSLPVCPSTLPSEGGFRNVIPEQFWNCAEVSIRGGASPGGPAPVPAPAPAPTPIPPGSKRPFRSFHRTYLSAWNDGTVRLQNAASGWEQWSMVSAGNGKVYLLSTHGNYLSAWPDGVRLAQRPQGWEQWTVVSNSDGSVSFLSFHGTYLSAWPERQARLAPHNRDWEHWF